MRTGEDAGTEGPAEVMRVWRLEPVATPQDPYWQGRPIYREVIVRAPSAAQARLIAASLARDPDDPIGSLERVDLGLGFESEKLYRAVALPPDEAMAYAGDRAGLVRAVPADGPSEPRTVR